MTGDLKGKTLATLLLIMIVTVLIAAALPLLEFKPGIPLPFQEWHQETLPSDQTPTISISVGTSIKAILEFVLILVLAYGGYKLLIKGIPWKEILLPIIVMAALGVMALYVLFSLLNVHIDADLVAPEILPPALNISGLSAGDLPSGLLWLVCISLAVGIVLLGTWLVLQSTKPTTPADRLEREAERAIEALQSASDLKDVIVRCYLQMSQALQDEQGIAREQTMTAREFERLVEDRGIPHAPVHQLTQLFETIRYGGQLAGPEDEQRALDCLNAILKYSRTRRSLN